MKRRQLMGYLGASLGTALFTTLSAENQVSAQASGSLSVQWLGHTCFLFTGGGVRILVNPFRTVGCTAKYRAPRVAANLVMISSQLLDEGAVEGLPGNPRLMFEPGVYKSNNIQFEGMAIAKDREGGRRFGTNVAWKWRQAGVNILHLGGVAAPISIEQKILMGRPDVAFVPVGGGPKAYNPQEASEAIKALNPKIVIPTHYRTQAADSACDISPLDDFLQAMQGTNVRKSNSDTITINARSLSDTSVIQVLSYKF
jgi:L-ascorbate metabolism protein UlaG (beta-lactamase superfamily)